MLSSEKDHEAIVLFNGFRVMGLGFRVQARNRKHYGMHKSRINYMMAVSRCI